jgi:hypothetical protein
LKFTISAFAKNKGGFSALYENISPDKTNKKPSLER